MKHVLILEDTIDVVHALTGELARLEREINQAIIVTVFGTSTDVEEIVNHQSANTYDAIILDRNCKLGGSFHVLDIEKFGAERTVSISSLPHLNEQVKTRGVTRAIDKDHARLKEFAEQVIVEIKAILKV